MKDLRTHELTVNKTNIECHFTLTVLQNFPNIYELRIAEAILIKEKSPIINVKYNETYNSLNL